MVENNFPSISYAGDILIVEDDPAFSAMLTSLLKETGHSVHAITNGKTALQHIQNTLPDLILLDIMLPDIDGIEICRRLKTDPATQAVPVIFITALTNMSDKIRGFEAGAVDYITKPCNNCEVLARVHTHLSLRRTQLALQLSNAQTEAAKQQAETRLRSIFENSTQSFLLIDRERAIRLFNPIAAQRARKATGKEMQLGDPIDWYVLESDKPDFDLHFEQALNGEKAWMEAPFVKDNKTLGWLEFYFSPVHDPAGNIIQVLSVVQDITARKQAEVQIENALDALRESEERYRILLDESPDPVFSFGPEAQYLYVNKALAAAFGKTVDQFYGKTIRDMFDREEGTRRITALQQAFQTGEKFTIEGSIPNLSGNRFYLTTVTPIKNNQGRVLSAICSSKDITERRQMEEDLRRALQEKEILLRELYHRTKNNMMVISSLLSLQAGNSPSQEVITILQEVQDKIQAMAMVHQKLYQSQSLSNIDLGDYLAELATLLINSHRILPSDISLKLKMEKIPALLDTAMPCGLILSELLSNTLKYAFPGGARGVIQIALTNTPDDEITLLYADDGVGVPEGFDFREQPTLGLKTIFMIVEHQLEGKIDFENDHGLTCRIRFKNNNKTAIV